MKFDDDFFSGIRLDNVLKRRSVWTVGDFAGLSAAAIPEINFIREPKLENVKRVLEKYQPSSPTKSHGSKSSDVKDSGDSETTTLKQKEDSQAADIYHSFDDSGSDNVMVKPSESESNEKDSEGMNVESEAKKTLDSESMKTPEKRPPAMDITPKRTITPLIRKTKSARDFTKLNDDDDTPTRNEGIDSNIAGNDNVNVNGERIGNESDDHNGNGHKNIDESMEVDETSGNEGKDTVVLFLKLITLSCCNSSSEILELGLLGDVWFLIWAIIRKMSLRFSSLTWTFFSLPKAMLCEVRFVQVRAGLF